MRSLGILCVAAVAVGSLAMRADVAAPAETPAPAARAAPPPPSPSRPAPPADPGTAFPMGFSSEQPVPDSPHGASIHAAAKRHDLNPELVRAIVRCESQYDPHAVSEMGARGLLQLMPDTAARFGVSPDELSDPERNLEAGVRYLSWLNERFDGNLRHVLAAFNSGEGSVDRYDGVPPYSETRRFVARVYAELGLDARARAKDGRARGRT
ncbi:MAG: lytic transglycosylase domain-containing protein [Thermoanaerobaculia bacterium]|nr:lytic transglycosylase domain-containing protein [Thermoanaerobaculia bacterium]